MLDWMDYLLAALAALAAGAINALAGGGTLITFPTLIALGIPPIAANITSTVALCPGYFGATLAQLKDIRTQTQRLWLVLPAAVLGGVLGGVLLLNTEEKVFQALVPFLILLASLLLAIQTPLRAWLTRRLQTHSAQGIPQTWAIPLILLAAIYGGYFGAGLSVIVLAALALILDDSLTRLNALKQAVAFGVNIAAAVFFLFSGKVIWMLALVMACGALLGGVLGGKLASSINPNALRWLVVSIGVMIAVIYWIK
ncbi:sulfite exporter TauE/SafE family protein [Thiothrix subterranea]|uniref:Probable membrane transporter protein n=1 Tax=Thiothrix subterranea TaxID=2735563 RepID=A0AA51MIH9_9GAMM|nr:sulfite exporter TauE/SafE family protein [Thiothrix subterranea]MDQ5770384.1 sulfite exporter TauE/SafE family protein [Thiothrix subterranea]WML85092.1 sulfite exporter TauE/SafE family protein [Thiothrix subterranea]